MTINRLHGFAGSVGLALAGLPGGATASFSPLPATTASTLAIHAPAATGFFGTTYTLTIKGHIREPHAHHHGHAHRPRGLRLSAAESATTT